MLVGNTCVKEACFKASLTKHEEHKVFVMLAGTRDLNSIKECI